MPSDRIILGRTNGSFVCADFTDAKGIPRPGWLPGSAVDREATSLPTPADWFGEWSAIEAKITLKPSSKAGAVSISGEATWGTLDPERVKAGAIHMGSIEGVASPNGAGLSFALGANSVTLPVDKGEEGDCKVWMRRLGPYLLVSDKNNCGGMNVSFWGVYTRKGAAPKEPAALASAAGGAPPASPLQQTARVVAEPAASTTTPAATGWTYTYFSAPEPHFVGSSPTSQQAKIWLLCQPKPRSTEFRIDPGVYDQKPKKAKSPSFRSKFKAPRVAFVGFRSSLTISVRTVGHSSTVGISFPLLS